MDAWTLVAQQLFAWSRHILCRTTFLYKVVWLNCCPCGRTLMPLGRQERNGRVWRDLAISNHWVGGFTLKNYGNTVTFCESSFMCALYIFFVHIYHWISSAAWFPFSIHPQFFHKVLCPLYSTAKKIFNFDRE